MKIKFLQKMASVTLGAILLFNTFGTAQALLPIKFGVAVPVVSPNPYNEFSNIPLELNFHYDNLTSQANGTAKIFEPVQNKEVANWNFPLNTFSGTGDKKLTWNVVDGLYKNTKIIPGANYKFQVFIQDGAATYDQSTKFEITTPTPTINISNVSKSAFNPYLGEKTGITYTYKYLLAGVFDTKVFINNNQTNQTVFDSTLGTIAGNNNIFTWDGNTLVSVNNWKPVAPGQYTLTLKPVLYPDGAKSIPLEIIGPNLTTPTFSRAVYNPLKDGKLTISTTLQNSSNSTLVTARIYPESDQNKTSVWTSHYSNQASGPKNFQWDGYNLNSQQLAAGTYVFEAAGTDGTYQIPTSSNSFTISYNNDPSALCAGFPDVAANDLSCPAFTWTKSMGLITGNGGDGTLRPNDVLQRDQVAKISLLAGKLYNAGTNYCFAGNPFPDISIADWAFQYICDGKALGIIKGYTAAPYAGLYKPGLNVNRVEYLSLILRALNKPLADNSLASYNDVPGGLYYSSAAKYSFDHQLFTGSNLNPGYTVTRREASQILYKMHLQGEL